MSRDAYRVGIHPEEYFRVLVEQATDGIFISSPRGVYLDVNASGHRMLGYEPGELIGKRMADLVSAQELARLDGAIAGLMKGEVQTQEWAMLRKDGTSLEAEMRAQLLSSGLLLGIVRDLGPRNAIERKVRASEAQLRSTLETAPDVIMTVDRSGMILFINRTLPPQTLEQEQVVGTSWLDYVPSEARPRVAAALERVFMTRQIDEYEVQGPRGSGGERPWLSVRMGPVIEAHRVVAATLCATDVTGRRYDEARSRALEEQLRQSQKVESIGKLAGGVAHDFNNLLTSVIGFVELALMEVSAGSQVAEYLGYAVGSARSGAALTQQLLAFARKKVVRPELVTLNEVLEGMAPMIRRLVGENRDLVLALASELGMVKIDVGGLEQVIMNLVVNARDAIRGAGRIRIETENVSLDADYCRTHVETTPGDYVMLGVSDTGTGMAADVRCKLFEPFFTTKPMGEGSGLGLAMCHGIVKQAGGNISVHSEVGKGSTFCIFLPRAAPARERPARSPARASSPEAPVPPACGDETLLLVEDEEMIVRVAGGALSALGYRLLTAADGVQALDLVARSAAHIDLLITDVVMPNMGGRELARRLSALQPDVRVLFSSGYTSDAIVEDPEVDQDLDFLQKPYTPAVLAKRVRDALDRV